MSRTLKYFLIGLGLLVTVYVFWYFRSIVAYILISAVLSIIGRPVVELLDKVQIKKVKVPRAVSALIALIILWAVLIAFFIIFIPLIANEGQRLSTINVQSVVDALQVPFEKVSEWFARFHIATNKSSSFEEYLANEMIRLLNIGNLTDVVGGVASTLGELFIAIFAISFLAFFFLKDERLFVDGVLLLSPSKYEENVKHFLSSCKYLLTRYFVGIVLEITSLIILLSVGLKIVGLNLQLAVVIALVIGVLNVVPYLGPLIGWIIGLLLAIANNLDLDFAHGIVPLMIYMIIVFGVVKIIDDVLFQPFIYGASVRAHPVEIFLVILVGASLAGIPGMILAIPTYTVLRVFAKEFFNQYKLVKKLTDKID